MKVNKDGNVMISVQVPEYLAKKLDNYAHDKRMSRSDIMRAAINEYISNHPIERK